MTTSRPFSYSFPVTIGPSGTGTVSAGPIGGGETWALDTVRVRCSSNVSEAACLVSTSHIGQVDQTTSGSTGDSTDNVAGQVLKRGDTVTATWTGADVGAQAYMIVNGTRTF